MKQRFLAGLLALAPLSAAGAQDAPDDSQLSLSGFGTLGAAHSNSREAQFVRYNQAKGVSSSYGIGTDSNLGLQAAYKLTPELSATAQVLTRKYTSARYTTDLAWAFLKFKPDPDFSLRLGRVVVPSFMTSDYRSVGYANTMVRPPAEMYTLAPIENVDGADLTYQHSFGTSTFTAQLAGGVSHGQLFIAGGSGCIATYRAPLYTLNLALENGPFMLRLSQMRAELDSSSVGPLNKLTQRLNKAGFAQLARDLSVAGGKRVEFTSLGLTMDWHDIVLQSEYGMRRALEPVYLPNDDAWYLMAGYRIGAFLPYYSHAATRQAGRSVTLPANFPLASPLGRAVDRGFLTSGQQHSDLLGLRWNFAKSRALKLQVDRIRPTVKSGSMIFGPPNGVKHAVIVTALALDFVF
ncbi:opacity protein-like surface antigen [Oxalobacteraceae bacterium GrIS 1.11]